LTEIRVYDRAIDMVCEQPSAHMDYEPDIEPEEVAAEDNVTLVYEILE
jgi:hypothetical protein